MHLIIVLSSFCFLHFLLFTCIEGLMVTVYIKLLASLPLEALLLEALTRHGCRWTTVMAPCHHLQGWPLEPIKFMDHVFVEALSPNHHQLCAGDYVPEQRIRRQASMLVYVKHTNTLHWVAISLLFIFDITWQYPKALCQSVHHLR